MLFGVSLFLFSMLVFGLGLIHTLLIFLFSHKNKRNLVLPLESRSPQTRHTLFIVLLDCAVYGWNDDRSRRDGECLESIKMEMIEMIMYFGDYKIFYVLNLCNLESELYIA